MAANESTNEAEIKDDELNSLICPIRYGNALPDPDLGGKLLPCGKTLMQLSEEPVSFPQVETEFNYHFKGLHVLFDIDLINPNASLYSATAPAEMDPRDAALLADIEALHITIPNSGAMAKPPRALASRELFMKERAAVSQPQRYQSVPHRPMKAFQSQAERRHASVIKPYQTQAQPLDIEMETISLAQQRAIIEQTFVDIEKPLGRHPTNAGSNARPVAQFPIFPDSNLSQFEFAHVQFGIPPSNTKCFFKDVGNHFVNFKLQTVSVLKEPQLSHGLSTYISDQRFREERTSDTDRSVSYLLQEKDGSYYYQMSSKNIKLRKERPNAKANYGVQLLVKRAKTTARPT